VIMAALLFLIMMVSSASWAEEVVQIEQVSNPLSKVSVLLEIAEDQMAQIRHNIAEDGQEELQDFLEGYEVIIQKIGEATEEVTAETGLDRAIEAVSGGTAKHIAVLESVLDKVPEEAREAIQHAIEVSKHGREVALSRLQEIENRHEQEKEQEMEQEQRWEQKRWQEEEQIGQNEEENAEEEEQIEKPEKPEHPEKPNNPRGSGRCK